jgi:hypothetical protein
MEHQRQQADRLGLVRQQRGHQPAEPNSFFGEIAAANLGTGGIGPTFGEGGIDRREHRIETVAELGTLGHAKRDGGLPDLGLGAHQPLAHGRRRDQERRGDGGGVETEHGLQDQRGTDAGSMAGWAQANISASRSSGMSLAAAAASSSAIIRSSATAPSLLCRRRNASIILRRATAMSHASALSGIPRAGQSTSAASDEASSLDMDIT